MSSDTARSAPQASDAGAADAPSEPTAGTPGADVNDDDVILPAREREMLAFERQWWRYAGAKEAAIRERFGMSATRYYQVLNALAARPEARPVTPLLVRGPRRRRPARQRQHTGRT